MNERDITDMEKINQMEDMKYMKHIKEIKNISDIIEMSALHLSEMIKNGSVTVKEAACAYLGKIAEKDDLLGAFITVAESDKLQNRIEEVQKGIEEGRYTSKLAGVPIAIKDNICTKGLRTTCASKMLENFVPSYDAEVIRRLEAAGMIVIGKTNMDEFAMGSTTETSYFKVTRNPHNTENAPGGSSGGSCVAVAAGEAPIALGSDTGGSIRQPAAHCGVTGFKPTYGRVSRFGLIAYVSSLDQIGPVGKDVADCKALYEIISGYDEKDSTSLKSEDDYFKDIANIRGMEYKRNELNIEGKLNIEDESNTERKFNIEDESNLIEKFNNGEASYISEGNRDSEKYTTDNIDDICSDYLKGKTIGIPKEYMADGTDDEVKNAILNAIKLMEKAGAKVEFFSLKMVDYVVPAYYIIACAEASSNLERFDGVKYGYRNMDAKGLHEMYKKSRTEGFGKEVKRRIMLGSFVLSAGYYDAYYMKALKTKRLIKNEFDEAFKKYDCIISPVSPTTAPKLGTSLSDPLKMYLSDIYTVSANLCGLPALSMPCGVDSHGLPIGLQFIGDLCSDDEIFNLAAAYEKVRGDYKSMGNEEDKVSDIDMKEEKFQKENIEKEKLYKENGYKENLYERKAGEIND